MTEWINVYNVELANEYAELFFQPRHYYLGRLLGRGPNLTPFYELTTRPFLGPTSMDCEWSYFTACAANIHPNDRVLDPFAGSGSLLLSCAHWGAQVTGSDISPQAFGMSIHQDRIVSKRRSCLRTLHVSSFDDDCRSSPLSSTATATLSTSSWIKSLFQRTTSQSDNNMVDQYGDQSELNIFSNFIHYRLDHQLESLYLAEIDDWITLKSNKQPIVQLKLCGNNAAMPSSHKSDLTKNLDIEDIKNRQNNFEQIQLDHLPDEQVSIL